MSTNREATDAAYIEDVVRRATRIVERPGSAYFTILRVNGWGAVPVESSSYLNGTTTSFTYNDVGDLTSRVAVTQGPASPASTSTSPHQDMEVDGTRYTFDSRGRNTKVGAAPTFQR